MNEVFDTFQIKTIGELLALTTIIIMPVKSLFWIPVHSLSRFFKKLGILTYLITFLIWIPLAYTIYINREFLLSFTIDLHRSLNIIGLISLIIGTIMHIWTGKVLSFFGLIGLPEIFAKKDGRLITKGPFRIVRHPTYLAHTIMFSGIFLMTGVITVGIFTLLDFIIVNAVIIPLEEKELLRRFGNEYGEYKRQVRWRFIPRIL